MKYIGIFSALLMLVFGCTKNSTPDEPFNTVYALQSSPEALVQHDDSNYGIYKGVVINAQDSAATLKFNFYNGNNQPYALLYRNLAVYDSLIRYQGNQLGMLSPQMRDTTRVLENPYFYVTWMASYKLGRGPTTVFSVYMNGLFPDMEVRLFNNASLNAVMKEKSNNQVRCFEGSYSGRDSGRIAWVMNSDSISVIRASIWNPQFYKKVTSAVTDGSFTIEQLDETSGRTFIFEGTVSETSCTGTWTRSSEPGVVNQFSAVRTL